MPPSSTCTVVIPCYNAEPYLEAAVASVQAQTFSDYHLVIVDDASPDATRELARKLTANQSNMTVIELPENRGRSFARNEGVRRTESQYVTFLDQDDTYHPDFLKLLVEAFNQTNDYDAIKVLPNLGINLDPTRYEAIANSLATTCLFRRAAFQFVGGWPESDIYRRHPGGCEDIALLELFNLCFNVGVLHGRLYNYTLRPGNALDRFLKRSSVVDGVLHVTGRTEDDQVLESENARLKFLLRKRLRQTLLNLSGNFVSLEVEAK
ncbi:MAG: glycosyltransferase family 2 protein [Gemmataceae bacterium]